MKIFFSSKFRWKKLPFHLLAIPVFGILPACTTFAPPVPLMTFGGPKTVEPKHWEVGMAIGSACVAMNNSFAGGSGYLARWRTGLSDKFDFGFDVIGAQHGESGTFTFKPAVRYQATEKFRIEAGLGGATDSDGKGIGGDLGFVVGSSEQNLPWNFYSALRLAGSFGLNDKYHRTSRPGENPVPSDAAFGLLSVGSSGSDLESAKFITEAGWGLVYLPGAKKTGNLFYIGAGVLFDISKNDRSRTSRDTR